MKINPRCPPSNFGHIIGHPLPPFGQFLGENKDGGEEGGCQEEPLSRDPLECFAALLATEEPSVGLIVVNQDQLKVPATLCYITGSLSLTAINISRHKLENKDINAATTMMRMTALG